jgi:hypothetical protein
MEAFPFGAGNHHEAGFMKLRENPIRIGSPEQSSLAQTVLHDGRRG